MGALVWSAAAFASDPITTPAPLSQEGCVSGPGDTCTYTSTRTGGYAANGSTWSLVISIPAAGDPRDVNLDGQLTYTIGPSNGIPQGCELFPAGSTVTTSGGSSGGVAGGNPFPGPSDGQVDNGCDGGALPNRTDVTPQ
jgi:hypothetical protein